ncbi:MAG: IclR family transcriptional regulator [Microbacteriaceae bacterium]|nr:MAG: IclR family transcriptional regulator [Microbacteriaceae bacterium]
MRQNDTTTGSPNAATRAAPHSQTLSRGIRMLETLAEHGEPQSIADLALALDVHRSIAYRILRTLEDHRLVIRDSAGLVQLGPRMAALARGVFHDLQSAALPELTAVANELAMTAFLVVLDQDECVTLVSVEPRHAVATVAQHPGTRHPLSAGAPGIAIQSRLTQQQWAALGPDWQMRDEALEARQYGYALSHDEVIPGLRSVAAPLVIAGQAPAAVAIVYVASDHDADELGGRLTRAASRIAESMR